MGYSVRVEQRTFKIDDKLVFRLKIHNDRKKEVFKFLKEKKNQESIETYLRDIIEDDPKIIPQERFKDDALFEDWCKCSNRVCTCSWRENLTPRRRLTTEPLALSSPAVPTPALPAPAPSS